MKKERSDFYSGRNKRALAREKRNGRTENGGKSMTREEAVRQLRDLINDRKLFLDKDNPSGVFQADIDALEYAVDFMESHSQLRDKGENTK